MTRLVPQVHHDLAIVLEVVQRALDRLEIRIGQVKGNSDDRFPIGTSPLVGEVAGGVEVLESLCLQLAIELVHVLLDG